MTVLKAQIFIVVSSLALTGTLLLFYILSPSLGYPLEFDQAIRLTQINTPIFLGFLGSATQFLFTGDRTRARLIDEQLEPLLKILVVGPIAVFAVATIACLFAFGVSNGKSAAPGQGMSIDSLSVLLTAILGLLAVTTSVIVSYLFSTVSEKAA
jgi:hypothetical protein